MGLYEFFNDLLIQFDKEVTLPFKDCYNLDLAYAISIHSSQGSEYRGVIIPISLEHQFMLSRNLIYTAITRGKEKVILFGQENAFRNALKYVARDLRYTNLSHVLKDLRQ